MRIGFLGTNLVQAVSIGQLSFVIQISSQLSPPLRVSSVALA
jgi:hypothetical protein